MTSGQDERKTEEERRRKRRAEQLRANLQRRKSQNRSRRAGEEVRRPEGLDPARREADE